ncbi:ParA family protein [Methylomonas sp. OY6]|uniref:ParA family protein n=1 Tax=Methylomonas defluvii TaxID=3045149 RepID=A0ABU4UBT7_9GAMM|nr:ParA family protein [Methylomonas sp. OY6]MDX8126916.1 ParA family protein [Methylomonas sp. OY6]
MAAEQITNIPDYAKLKVLTIGNHKGGVAKTTLSKLLTEYSVRKGKRVLGIDIDPQCNFSARFVQMTEDGGTPPFHPNFDPKDPTWDELPYAPPGYWSIAEFFRLGYAEPYPTDHPTLSFIPSHKRELTSFLEQVERNSIQEAVVEHMRAMLSMEYYQDEFDLVIVDTPPQTSALTASAARAATHLLIPTEMQEDSVAGMADMAQLWQAENQVRDTNKLQLIGILATKYDPQSAAQRKTMEQLIQNEVLGDKLIYPPMRYLQTYANSSSTFANPRSLFEMHENTPARNEAEQFCKVIFERIFK